MITSKFLSFDLETAKLIDDDFSQWRANRPLGIICAATRLNGEDTRVWYSRDAQDQVCAQMTREDLVELIDYLEKKVEEGYHVLTWNGLAFDFDILAEESGAWERCKNLAINHTDMMFDFVCRVGYPIGLEKASTGMGFAGKYNGIHGDQAPLMWKQGRFEEVLDYVAQDASLTLELAAATQKARKICWTSQRGRYQETPITNGWNSVKDAARLPMPDVSWMKNPINRQDFYRWTKR